MNVIRISFLCQCADLRIGEICSNRSIALWTAASHIQKGLRTAANDQCDLTCSKNSTSDINLGKNGLSYALFQFFLCFFVFQYTVSNIRMHQDENQAD